MNGTETSNLLAAVEERRREEKLAIFESIHDRIGGSLTAVGLELGLLEFDLPPDLVSRLKSIQATLEQAFVEVRSLSYAVHPDPVGRFGFRIAIGKLIERFGDRTGRRVQCNIDGTPRNPEAVYAIIDCLLNGSTSPGETQPVFLELTDSRLFFRDPHASQLDSHQQALLDNIVDSAQFVTLPSEDGTIIEDGLVVLGTRAKC